MDPNRAQLAVERIPTKLSKKEKRNSAIFEL